MRTLITSSGESIQSQFDKRFGRAAWFCLYDDKTNEIDFHENKSIETSNGAGTKAAELMVEMKIDKVISGDFGPKSKELLEKFNIQMVILPNDDVNIENIIQKLSN